MPTLMLYAIFLFTIALLFYSISVWAGWFSKRLKLWHLNVFFIGFLADVIATILTYVALGGLVFTLHSMLGFISIALMAMHVAWATTIMWKRDERAIGSFHRISVFVWSIWMISYLSGFVLGVVKVA